MIDPKKFEQFARYMQDSLPKFLRYLGNDIEKKIHQILKHRFNCMDFVSREEFDVQTRILLHVRKELNRLESRLNIIEKTLEKKLITDPSAAHSAKDNAN
ncbi:accessory factor UbiK family protein [Sodalis sp. CWE]|uniref:accessory factor UbiK family protein n=1 Tax=Sodalis sp. CWE TaxID=2803816 RepID=UPI001C7DD3E2|nr:accessory factor UbiK family protein [Sodalis sp. CWE]MBX4180822.1 accessory factor UbiK family protein [Sodalis sp. CWE]